MTRPNDTRTTGTPPPGSRASDYASSKYYFPPALPPMDDTDPGAVDAGEPASLPAGYPPPDIPVAPVRRSRGRSRLALGVALVLALLAGVLGGGYWMLHRHDDAASASPAGNKVASITDVGKADGKPATTSKASGSYLFRPPRRHFVVRLPHRPTTRTVPLSYAGLSGSALLMLDRDSKAAVEWLRIDSGIPVAQQQPFMRGAVTGLDRSSSFTVRSARSVTFHGRPARLVSLEERTGTSFTALIVVYRPTHALIVLAPTGPTYNLIKNSFRWPV